MSTEMETNARPNIRIEIQNTVSESTMEVDEEPLKPDSEEGEIHEPNDEEIDDSQEADGEVNTDWDKPRSVFTTGINIFAKEKLQERAKRFALKPEEINAFTDEDLKVLYESLGISPENENEVRFDAIHMIGVQGLLVEDILEYFAKYAPNKIEWISEDSCNVVWLENIATARALHYNSKHVRGMPVRAPSDPFVKEFLDDFEEPDKETGQSILLKNKNREVQLKEDEIDISLKKPDPKHSVDISEITIPVPPGYWRLGEKHPKSKCILLRFALKIDKQPYQSESLLKYYKKVGTGRNVIPENNKKEIRSIFERNKDFISNDKNPWGSLARNWDHDAKYRERDPIIPVEERSIEVKNPKLLARLGVKRSFDEVETDDLENVIEPRKTIKENRKTKMPRMRMYADEEEEKLKRKQALQKIKRAEEVAIPDESGQKDLRNVLGHVRRPIVVVDDPVVEEPELPDLGAKLKNRNKNMVFAVERNVIDENIIDNEQVEADIRTMLALRHKERQRSHAIDRHERVSERNRLSEKSKEPERERYSSRTNEPARKHRRHHSPVRTLHSDRISESSRKQQPARRRSRSRDYDRKRHPYDAKPKSKVAVVIKTQKKPTVASTVWSRVNRSSDSNEDDESSSNSEESESEQSSSSSSSSSDDDSDSDSSTNQRKRPSLHVRPGFNDIKKRIGDKMDHRSPLKITMPNDHFKK